MILFLYLKLNVLLFMDFKVKHFIVFVVIQLVFAVDVVDAVNAVKIL